MNESKTRIESNGNSCGFSNGSAAFYVAHGLGGHLDGPGESWGERGDGFHVELTPKQNDRNGASLRAFIVVYSKSVLSGDIYQISSPTRSIIRIAGNCYSAAERLALYLKRGLGLEENPKDNRAIFENAERIFNEGVLSSYMKTRGTPSERYSGLGTLLLSSFYQDWYYLPKERAFNQAKRVLFNCKSE
jgi:hypothetical protein